MQALLKPLLELAEYEDIVKKKKEAPGVLMLTGCVNSQKTHMMYALSDGCCYKVIACSSEAKAKQIYEEYRFLDAAISFYPAKDLLFYQADIRSKELISQRMQVIQAVLKGEPITVVASFDAFMDALLPKEMIKSRVIKICSDETLNLDELSVNREHKPVRYIFALNKRIGFLDSDMFLPFVFNNRIAALEKKNYIEFFNTEKFDIIIGAGVEYSLLLGEIKENITAKTIGWQHSTYDSYFEKRGATGYGLSLIHI